MTLYYKVKILYGPMDLLLSGQMRSMVEVKRTLSKSSKHLPYTRHSGRLTFISSPSQRCYIAKWHA